MICVAEDENLFPARGISLVEVPHFPQTAADQCFAVDALQIWICRLEF